MASLHSRREKHAGFRGAGTRAFVLAAGLCAGAVWAIPASTPLGGLTVERWGAADGIPEETFADIISSGDGYVWLASNHGIVRFDGTRGQTIRVGDAYRKYGTGPCLNSSINSLTMGPRGEIWAAAASGCVFRLGRDRFGTFANLRLEAVEAVTDERGQRSILELRRAPDGRSIEVVRRSGLFRSPDPAGDWGLRSPAEALRPRPAKEKLRIAPPDGEQIQRLARADGDVNFVLTSTGRVYRMRPGSAWERILEFPVGRRPRTIRAGRDGTLWLIMPGGLAAWKDGRLRTIPLEKGLDFGNPMAMIEDRAGCLWIGFKNRIGRLCGDQLRTRAIGVAEEEQVAALHEDSLGNLWVGGLWGNLYRLSPALFRVYTREAGLSESHLIGIVADRKGKIWGALREGGAAVIDGGQVASSRLGGEVAYPLAIAPHPESGVIVGNGDGLFHIDERRRVSRLDVHPPVRLTTPVGVRWDSAGRLLLSTPDATWRLRPNGGSHWSSESVAGPSRFRNWTVDREGVVWGVSQYRGLHRQIGKAFLAAEGASPERARSWYSVWADEEGLLWIGTSEGLEVYSPSERRLLTTAPMLLGEQIFTITADPMGYLWCATRSGLVRFARTHGLEAARSSGKIGLSVERYDGTQSLPTTNFGISVSAATAMDPQGRLWFAGMQGIVSILPQDFERKPRPPVALLLGVSSGGTEQDVHRPFALGAGTGRVEFRFQTIRQDSLGGDFCRQQLRGLDKDWQPCRVGRDAQFTNLSPGDYEFVVQTSSEPNLWNGREVRVPVTIEPAYYQRGWVQLLAIVLLTALGGTILVRRHRILLERNRLLEERVRERTVSLAQAMHHAQSANRAKSEFLATMSHEIRTPMNGVLGAVQLLAASPLAEEQEKLVAVIRRSGEDMVEIVDDILSLSQVEAGMLTIENSAVSPRHLCQHLVDLFRPKAEAKGVRMALEVEAALPEAILTDPRRLRQVLLNVVGNAVKFTGSGHVLVRVALRETTQIVFAVEDSGIGIAQEKLPSLFDPFVQADASATRRYGGSGLGLSIVKRFVEAMHGSVEVETELGRGSTFRIVLPLTVADESQLTPQSDSRLLEPAPPCGKTILLAEDNPVNQAVFQKMLSRLGYRVRLANHGEEALAILQEEPVDLVLMDCQMPELDGYETTRRIRTWGGPFRDLPVIALTASAMKEDRELCFSSGMNDFLSKPVVLSTLDATLRRWSEPEKMIATASDILDRSDPETHDRLTGSS